MEVSFPSLRTRRRAEKLLHHQCWFYGRDIWHPNGNLLINYGFERFAPPDGEKGGNSYRLRRGSDDQFVIWGFGIFFGSGKLGGVFIQRYGFNPRWTPSAELELPIWKPDGLSSCRLPDDDVSRRAVRQLTAGAIDEIVSYERWIRKNFGECWRDECLAQWEKASLTPEEVFGGWKTISKSIKSYEKRNSSGLPRSGFSRHIG